MIKEKAHKILIEKCEELDAWYQEKLSEVPKLLYSSIDVRDSGFKVASVDANAFPAGFNNICDVDQEAAAEIFNSYFKREYQEKVERLLLITEEHTANAYYWENVSALKKMIESSGREVQLAWPKNLDQALEVQSISGESLQVFGSTVDSQGKVHSGDFQADAVLSNNDFSQPRCEWSQGKRVIMNPYRELGWYQRKKSDHFSYYNNYAQEFSEIMGVNKAHFQIKTKTIPYLDVNQEADRKELARLVDEFKEEILDSYKEAGIDQVPSVFIKNNSGTYGLAVIQVDSGDEVLGLNNKTRKKMFAAKGGGDVKELILQEGIPSIVQSDGATAEPVIYMLGGELLGGFLRSHSKKGPKDSLNSPGAVYKRMCVSDLRINPDPCVLENVYGWAGKLSYLALGKEATSLVSF